MRKRRLLPLDKRDQRQNDALFLLSSKTTGRRKNKRIPKTMAVLFLSLLVVAGAFIFIKIRLQPLTANDKEIKLDSRRFPKYGTPFFEQTCNWTTTVPQNDADCTILVRPKPTHHEGIADWAANIVQGYILAQLKGGCRLLMDYGPAVDLSQVITPHMHGFHNWTVPVGYDCTIQKNHCTRQQHKGTQLQSNETLDTFLLPHYRHAYKSILNLNIFRANFRHIETQLPGFQLETGMACAMHELIELSPLASTMEPTLYTKILPTLRDEHHNLVMAVYIRTGLTDRVADAERSNQTLWHKKASTLLARSMENSKKNFVVTPYTKCVLQKEQEYLANNGIAFSKVVWMVVSDSQFVKQKMVQEYTSSNIPRSPSLSSPPTSPPRIIPREIITTQSRGIHTRPGRHPSTLDFAEGVIDWYLIGESDVVFTNGKGYTYGTTAAQRTARRVFDSTSCNELFFIREEIPPSYEEYMLNRTLKKQQLVKKGK